MAEAISRDNPNYLKWTFFAVMAACTLMVLYVDERFLFIPDDPEWAHIASVKWLLLPHGIFGAIALVLGAFQFSGRLRRANLARHRLIGRVYVAAILCVAAPVGLYIGITLEPREIYIEQYFQAGLWWLTTAIAFLCIRNRQVDLHRLWMMRSYGFCLVFVLSRVPDAFMHMSHQQLGDLLWSLTLLALIVPSLIVTLERLRVAAPQRTLSKAAEALGS